MKKIKIFSLILMAALSTSYGDGGKAKTSPAKSGTSTAKPGTSTAKSGTSTAKSGTSTAKPPQNSIKKTGDCVDSGKVDPSVCSDTHGTIMANFKCMKMVSSNKNNEEHVCTSSCTQNSDCDFWKQSKNSGARTCQKIVNGKGYCL